MKRCVRVNVNNDPKLAALVSQEEILAEYQRDKWRRFDGCESPPCAGSPEIFYTTERTSAESIQNTLAAKKICADCPFKIACLLQAFLYEKGPAGRHGVWGGTTPAERNRLADGVGKVMLASESVRYRRG